MRTSATVTVALLTAALGVGFISCAKTGADSETSSAGTRTTLPSSRYIRVYSPPDMPECDYEELRRVRGFWGRGMNAGEAFRRAVRDAGGDAAIDVTPIQGNTGVDGLEGMAIRFTDPECTH